MFTNLSSLQLTLNFKMLLKLSRNCVTLKKIQLACRTYKPATIKSTEIIFFKHRVTQRYLTVLIFHLKLGSSRMSTTGTPFSVKGIRVSALQVYQHLIDDKSLTLSRLNPWIHVYYIIGRRTPSCVSQWNDLDSQGQTTFHFSSNAEQILAHVKAADRG